MKNEIVIGYSVLMKNEIIIGRHGEHTFILAAVDSKFEVRIKDDEGDIDPTPALRFGKTIHDYADADDVRHPATNYEWMHRDKELAMRILRALYAWREWCDEEENEGELTDQLIDISCEHWDVFGECMQMTQLWNQHEREARSNDARHDI